MGITEDELLTLVEEAEEDGGIDTQESELIHSALDFRDLEVREILTPRINLTAIDVSATVEEIAKVFAETAFSRIPIYENTIDHIVGVIYQKDFYNYVYHKKKDLSAIIRPVHFITEGKKIGELLKELQKRKSHIAIVLDEFGGTVGLITLEDILEELVGEIWDEHDEVVEEIQKISDTEYRILGSANVEKLLEVLDIERKMDVLTVSGWVMDEIERVPQKGDKFTYDNLQVEVLSMDGNRVEEVKVEVML